MECFLQRGGFLAALASTPAMLAIRSGKPRDEMLPRNIGGARTSIAARSILRDFASAEAWFQPIFSDGNGV
jgi:hypothetical protein